MEAPSATERHGVPTEEAPLGVKIICVVGFFACFFVSFGSLGLIISGQAVFGIVVLFLTAVCVVVLSGLVTVRPWGWTGGMLYFGFVAVLNLAEGSAVTSILNLIIVGYLTTVGDYYWA